MRRLVLPALLALLPPALPAADGSHDGRQAEIRLTRALLAKPSPPATGHLRYENIRDDEVLEIRQIVAKYEPGAIVNIDSVIEGCDCAEGPACTDQVRVVSQQPQRPFILQLSKMDGHWDLGPLEKWQRAAADLSRRRQEIVGPYNAPDHRTRLAAFWERVDLLNQMEPRCESAAASAATR